MYQTFKDLLVVFYKYFMNSYMHHEVFSLVCRNSLSISFAVIDKNIKNIHPIKTSWKPKVKLSFASVDKWFCWDINF